MVVAAWFERRSVAMATVHAELVGNKILLTKEDLDRLVHLARQVEEVTVETSDDLPTKGLMLLAEKGGAFDWLAAEEDEYSISDLKVRYR
jgi:hypothetical protein